MSDDRCGIQVGQPVSDFKLDIFDPSIGDFDVISLAARKAAKG
jgi:hypothetical protein